ncbi:MAG: hypothetical protein FRX48_02985 [Lasallia pustulata]|uniref:Uncharacterized protein n=1 Tax=Lasallia pustulata TaxID=136370 RepID=A0A5M8PVZ4_9LECA|nr:MAG: hypothetical protein FRX48_02985 [Lasallia pustulata]
MTLRPVGGRNSSHLPSGYSAAHTVAICGRAEPEMGKRASNGLPSETAIQHTRNPVWAVGSRCWPITCRPTLTSSSPVAEKSSTSVVHRLSLFQMSSRQAISSTIWPKRFIDQIEVARNGKDTGCMGLGSTYKLEATTGKIELNEEDPKLIEQLVEYPTHHHDYIESSNYNPQRSHHEQP